MAYKIKIRYETGNSFGSHEEVDSLEATYTDIKLAEENLSRISEQYKYYKEYNSWNSNREALVERARDERWFTKSEYDKNSEYSMQLVADNGVEFTYCPFWLGYFETLKEAWIASDNKKHRIIF